MKLLELGRNGIDAARAIAMLSYRNYDTFEATQTDEEEKLENYRAAYLSKDIKAEKLRKRFSKESYFMLSKAMDSHHLGRGRNSVENALNQITAETLCDWNR